MKAMQMIRRTSQTLILPYDGPPGYKEGRLLDDSRASSGCIYRTHSVNDVTDMFGCGRRMRLLIAYKWIIYPVDAGVKTENQLLVDGTIPLRLPA